MAYLQRDMLNSLDLNPTLHRRFLIMPGEVVGNTYGRRFGSFLAVFFGLITLVCSSFGNIARFCRRGLGGRTIRQLEWARLAARGQRGTDQKQKQSHDRSGDVMFPLLWKSDKLSRILSALRRP